MRSMYAKEGLPALMCRKAIPSNMPTSVVAVSCSRIASINLTRLIAMSIRNEQTTCAPNTLSLSVSCSAEQPRTPWMFPGRAYRWNDNALICIGQASS